MEIEGVDAHGYVHWAAKTIYVDPDPCHWRDTLMHEIEHVIDKLSRWDSFLGDVNPVSNAADEIRISVTTPHRLAAYRSIGWVR
jgi:hypothetical protein